MRHSSYRIFMAAFLFFSLLLQSCKPCVHAIIEEPDPRNEKKENSPVQDARKVSFSASGPVFSSFLSEGPGSSDQWLMRASVAAPSASPLPAAVCGVVLPSPHQHPLASSSQSTPLSPTKDDVDMPDAQASPWLLTASSGEHVLLKKKGTHWRAILQHGVGSCVYKRTVPVVGSGDMDVLLAGLQGQDAWYSRTRVHVMASPYPPHSPCVYLGRIGLLGGMPPQQASSSSGEAWYSGPSMTLSNHEACTEVCHIPPDHRYKGFRFRKKEVENASYTICYVAAKSKEELDALAGIKKDLLFREKLVSDLEIAVTLERVEADGCKIHFEHHRILPESSCKHAALVMHGNTQSTGVFGQKSRIDIQLEVCIVKDNAPTSFYAFSQNPSQASLTFSSFSEEPAKLEIPQVNRAYEERLSALDYAKALLKKRKAALKVQISELENQSQLQRQRPPSMSSVVMAFGARAWRQYFGEVGEEPPLPACIDAILASPCPFWSDKRVKDTHLLVLIPAEVNGQPLTLNLLGKLIQSPKGGGHGTKYRRHVSVVQSELGDRSAVKSYWILMTRDELPDSRKRDYMGQRALVATHAWRMGLPYEMPYALEAATAILSHYTRTKKRLYADNFWTYTRCQERVDAGKYPVVVGGFSPKGLYVGHDDLRYFCNYVGVSCLRRFTEHEKAPFEQPQFTLRLKSPSNLQKKSISSMAFGAKAWERYFGEVGTEPPLPSNIDAILEGPCPFWPEKEVKDTHLLVLIPAAVGGQPFTLNLLEELVKSPKGGGSRTEYKHYNSDIRRELGNQPSGKSHWILMTRDVLPDSRGKTYKDQKELVAAYAWCMDPPYEIPCALEAATAILSHYTRTRERLYVDHPYTYTRCQEKVVGNKHSVIVGGFCYLGLGIDYYFVVSYYDGVSCLRRF